MVSVPFPQQLVFVSFTHFACENYRTSCMRVVQNLLTDKKTELRVGRRSAYNIEELISLNKTLSISL